MLKKVTFFLFVLISAPSLAVPEEGCGPYLVNLIKGLDVARLALREARTAKDHDTVEKQKAAIRYVLSEMRSLKELREELMRERVRSREAPPDDTKLEHADSEGSYLRDEKRRYTQSSDNNPWGFEAPSKPSPSFGYSREPYDIGEAQDRDNRKLGRMSEYFKRTRPLRTSAPETPLRRGAVADIRMAKGLEFEQLEELQSRLYSANLWHLGGFTEMLSYPNVHAFVALDQYENIMGYVVAFVGETKTLLFDSGVTPGFYTEKVLGSLLDYVHEMVIEATSHTTHVSASFHSADHPLYRLLEKRHYESKPGDSLTLRLDF